MVENTLYVIRPIPLKRRVKLARGKTRQLPRLDFSSRLTFLKKNAT